MGLGQGGHGEKKKRPRKRFKTNQRMSNGGKSFRQKKNIFSPFFFSLPSLFVFFWFFLNFFLLVERVGRPGSGCGPHDALRGRNEE